MAASETGNKAIKAIYEAADAFEKASREIGDEALECPKGSLTRETFARLAIVLLSTSGELTFTIEHLAEEMAAISLSLPPKSTPQP